MSSLFLIKHAVVAAAALLLPNAPQRALLGQFIPIFMFHRFSCPDRGIVGNSPELLRKNLEWMRRKRFQFLSLETALEQWLSGVPLPAKSAVVTVDDGFQDQFDIGAPLFEAYDCPATFFLISDFIDGKLWPWDDQIAHAVKHTRRARARIELPGGTSVDIALEDERAREAAVTALQDALKNQPGAGIYASAASIAAQLQVELPESPPPDYRPMSWQQAEQLCRRGHGIAPHSKTHRILSRLSLDASRDEIIGSHRAVATHISKPSAVFCYPTGRAADFSAREETILQEIGIKGAVSTELDYMTPASPTRQNPYALPRFAAPDSWADFAQIGTGLELIKARLHH